MSGNFVLYDLPSKEPRKCWSLNPWKTRLLLNYKDLPYETKWIEYPDIKPTFEGTVKPTGDGMYTIPTVRFPDGSCLQDSKEIAILIERAHPNPSVRLDSDILAKVEALMPKLMTAIAPEFIPKVPKRLLNEASLEYWYRTREARFGMPLDQVEREKGGDLAWTNAAPVIQEVTELLKKNNSGPFFEGSQVTYVDFVWAGYLRFMQRIGDDILAKALEASGDPGAHKALLEACGPWLSRDDH